jgi:hypothetical protein
MSNSLTFNFSKGHLSILFYREFNAAPGAVLHRPLAWRRRPSDLAPENFELLAVWLARDTTAPDQSGDYFSENFPGTSAKSATIPSTLLRRIKNPQ